MTITELLPVIDVIGYLGGCITLWGVYQKTMIPLRIGAVGGNVGFLLFGIMVPSYPTLMVHAVLLPINVYRTVQMIRLVREIREAANTTNNLDPLLPYMALKKEPAGTVLFRIDDLPDRMIVIKSGTILLEEIDVRCTDGDVLGEIAAFTPDNRRTCTATCETDCELFVLSNDAMIQLFFQNPQFGMFLTRVIVQRLLTNWREADARAGALLT